MELRPARPSDDLAIHHLRRRLASGVPAGGSASGSRATGDAVPPPSEPGSARPTSGEGEGGTTTVVAVEAGSVVGWVTVGASGDDEVGLVRELTVDPDHRRRGYGRRLLTAARRVLAGEGRARAELWAPTDEQGQPPPMPLDLGWRPDGPPRAITSLGRPVKAVRLVLDLDPEDHVTANRRSWNDAAPSYVQPGRRAYQPERRRSPTWGIFGVPEAEVGFLRHVAGCDVVELGCGTGYVSAWCLEAGARSAVALDNSPVQLATASVLQDEHDLHFPLVLADAERAPLAAASFDLVVSEYGAALWCDPHAWIPEAARLLRPGGRLVFLTNSVLAALCSRDYEGDGLIDGHLRRPQRHLGRLDFPDTAGVEFHLAHGDMIRLLGDNGFTMLDLVELYAPDGSEAAYGVDPEWARSWPVEEVWLAELR